MLWEVIKIKSQAWIQSEVNVHKLRKNAINANWNQHGA
jgi:hypothetical protein